MMYGRKADMEAMTPIIKFVETEKTDLTAQRDGALGFGADGWASRSKSYTSAPKAGRDAVDANPGNARASKFVRDEKG